MHTCVRCARETCARAALPMGGNHRLKRYVLQLADPNPDPNPSLPRGRAGVGCVEGVGRGCRGVARVETGGGVRVAVTPRGGDGTFRSTSESDA